MRELQLRGEYWYTDSGKLITVGESGDYNHEGIVMQHIISLFCDELRVENVYDTDACWFRTAVFDAAEGEEDPLDLAVEGLINRGYARDEVGRMRDLLGGSSDDAREFAVNYWKWIRISQAQVELPFLTSDYLRRAYRALVRAFDEEYGDEELPEQRTVRVSTYRGLAYAITLDRLGQGINPRNEVDTQTSAATLQVKKLDLALQPSFYQNRYQ